MNRNRESRSTIRCAIYTRKSADGSRAAIAEWHLRPIAAVIDWHKQRRM